MAGPDYGAPDAGAAQYPVFDHGPHGQDIPLPDGFVGDLMGCTIGPGDCIPFDPVLITHCHWLPGACFYLGESAPKDMNMPLPPGFPPPKHAKPSQALPAPTPAPAAHVPDLGTPVDMAQIPPAAPPVIPALPAVPSMPTVPSIVQSDGGADSAIPHIPAGALSSPLGIVALGIGALTTGAAWKFWQNRSKLKHEERMKELENQPKPDEDQKEKCEAAAANCAKSSKELSERLDDVLRKLAPALEQIEQLAKKVEQADEAARKATRKAGEVEELDERLSVVERKQKIAAQDEKLAAKKPAKKGGK